MRTTKSNINYKHKTLSYLNLLRNYMEDFFGVSKCWSFAIISLEKYHTHLMELNRESCTFLTVLTSRGSMNTIRKQRYQANNVAMITSLCCFLKSPYRWRRNKARKKTNTISRPNAAPLIVKCQLQPHHTQWETRSELWDKKTFNYIKISGRYLHRRVVQWTC